MTLSSSNFIYEIIEKHISVRDEPQLHAAKTCWLCGEPANISFPLRKGISKTFCLSEQSRFVNGDIICLPCHAMSSKKYFDAYAGARPEMGLKPGYATSWRNYSHVAFSDHHSCPNRSEWSKWLLNPPEPPFLFVMAISSQKHLIYKSKVSDSGEMFFVQMEDETIQVERKAFAECFGIIQELLNLGFLKTHILTNKYPYKSIMEFGRNEWKSLNDSLSSFRKLHPQLIELGCFCGVNKEKKKK
jgi:hypothetical protein